MAKIRMTLEEKIEGFNPAGGALTYSVRLAVKALTTDAGVPIGQAGGDFRVDGLSAAQVAGLVTGTVFNCPVQP